MPLAVPFAVQGLALLFGFSPPPLSTPPLEPAPQHPEGVRREPGTPTTLYVNFDGAVLRRGCGNDATRNCSTLASTFGGYVGPFYGHDQTRASVLELVRKDVADFGVIVTGVRPPPDVEYSMVVYGDVGPQSFAGIAPYIDCEDRWLSDTSFSAPFTGAMTGATVVLQEAAHTWGLEHVNSPEDILHPITEGAAPSFQDQCNRIVANTNLDEAPGGCNVVHEQFCDPGFQNSWEEMRWLFGPPVPDTDDPVLEIVEPLDGSVHELSNPIELRVEVADERHPQYYEMELLLDGTPAFAGQEWGDSVLNLNPPETGDYSVEVRVTDEAGNTGSATVHFEVVDQGSLDPELTETGCRSQGRVGAWGLVVGLCLLRRRRRRAS